MQQSDIDKILSYKDSNLSSKEIAQEVFGENFTDSKRRAILYYFNKHNISLVKKEKKRYLWSNGTRIKRSFRWFSKLFYWEISWKI